MRSSLPEQPYARGARSVVVGTAGHIDHGKTALVRALTGTDPDRLPEEKARGITIDLGFAVFRVGDSTTGTMDVSLIDVPGHHAFIHNMLAGTGGINAVLLIIAADEGVKAQTVEHLQICNLLGIRHGIVVLTKCDATDSERLEHARNQARALVQNTFLEGAPIVSVSARTGEGIDALKKTLLELALELPEQEAKSVMRLPLDRAFSIAGFGTVVTGTLHSGAIAVGETVELQPKGRSLRVRSVQVHRCSVTHANAPTRVALNLPGIEVAELHRGDVIVGPHTLAPTSSIDVELTVLPGANPVKHRRRVMMYAFTSEASATVLLYDRAEQNGPGTCLARLRLGKPMLLVPGDRFVLRSAAGLLGGGVVLDARPLAHVRKPAAHEWLKHVREASPAEQILARVRRRGLSGITAPELVEETGLREKLIQELASTLARSHDIADVQTEQVRGHRFLSAEAAGSAVDLVWRELLRDGSGSITRAELLSRTRLQESVFSFAVARVLETKPVRVTGSHIAVVREAPNAGATAELLAKIEALYRSAGLASPIVSEVASLLRMSVEELARQITLLLRSGKLVRMGSDNLLIHADALEKLRADIARNRGEILDVGRFKQMTGLTRKHAIPLLEYLDRTHVTINLQGVRTIR